MSFFYHQGRAHCAGTIFRWKNAPHCCDTLKELVWWEDSGIGFKKILGLFWKTPFFGPFFIPPYYLTIFDQAAWNFGSMPKIELSEHLIYSLFHLTSCCQFCRKPLKYGTLCRKNVVYTLWAEENEKLCGEPTLQFIPPCSTTLA